MTADPLAPNASLTEPAHGIASARFLYRLGRLPLALLGTGCRTGTPRGYVVALHGIQSHSGWYEYSSGRMCEAGFEVRFLDRRGSGENTEDRGHAVHPDRLDPRCDAGSGGRVLGAGSKNARMRR